MTLRALKVFMKSYPSITSIRDCHDIRKIEPGVEIVAFDKLDGSNIRAEWSLKKGFYKFGSRKRLIDEKDTHLGKAVSLIKENYSEALPKIFARQKWHQNVVCFFEFFGPHSFAGQHRKKDDHQVVMFDVAPFKQGFVHPEDFIKYFSEVGIPQVLYRGKVTEEFILSVKDNTLPGITLEGVVCKAPNPRKKKTGKPVMFKVKTQDWLDKLREHCGEDARMYEMLK